MVKQASVITALSSALPNAVTQADLWSQFFSARTKGRRAAKLAFSSSGVERRHAVANPIEEDVSSWSTAARMERYLDEAMPLGKGAVSDALSRANLDPGAIGLLVTVSCTGYATPGIDVRLARDLDMSPDLKRVFIGHMGCHAALPALDVAHNYVLAEHRPAIVLCLELPSLHLQPASDDLEDVIIHALFSDAAAACVLEPSQFNAQHTTDGLSVLDSISISDAGSSDAMTWTITDFGFRMTLSRRVPEIVATYVAPMVDQLLARNGIEREEIRQWAVHPGGPRILDVVEERLGLAPEAISTSRRVLAEHGNCSSATLLLVLEELWHAAAAAEDGYVVALTFGPGLTLCATLLRWTRPHNS